MSKHKNKWKNKWKNQGFDWKYGHANAKLYIEPKAYEKMSYYVQLADGEISGFGKIKHVPDPAKSKWFNEEKFILEDVEIFEQSCSGGGTTLQEEQLSKFIVKMAKAGQEPHDWRLWWHSHCDFGVFWSAIDEMAIKGLTEVEGADLLSVCINKDADVIARRDTNKSNGQLKQKNETLDVHISPRLIQGVYLKCEKEFKAKVTHQRYIITPHDDWKKDDWKWNFEDKSKDRLQLPLLLAHRSTPKYVQPITSRDALEMGLYFSVDTGLFIRLSDGQGFTMEEVRNGLYEAK